LLYRWFFSDPSWFFYEFYVRTPWKPFSKKFYSDLWLVNLFLIKFPWFSIVFIAFIRNYLNFLFEISFLNSDKVSFCPTLLIGLNFEKFVTVYFIEIPSEMSSSFEKLLANRAAKLSLNIYMFLVFSVSWVGSLLYLYSNF